jgi:hypothetical protein
MVGIEVGASGGVVAMKVGDAGTAVGTEVGVAAGAQPHRIRMEMINQFRAHLFIFPPAGAYPVDLPTQPSGENIFTKENPFEHFPPSSSFNVNFSNPQ